MNNISFELVEKLNYSRAFSNVPFVINSASRCFKHNLSESGSYNSSHLEGLAVDIKVLNSSDRFVMVQSLIGIGFNRIGIYKDFIHVDIDKTKTQNVIWHK